MGFHYAATPTAQARKQLIDTGSKGGRLGAHAGKKKKKEGVVAAGTEHESATAMGLGCTS